MQVIIQKTFKMKSNNHPQILANQNNFNLYYSLQLLQAAMEAFHHRVEEIASDRKRSIRLINTHSHCILSAKVYQ